MLCVLPSLYVAFAEHARDFWSIRSFSFFFARRLDPHGGFHHEWQRSSGGMKSRANRARASGGDDLESLRLEIAQLRNGQPRSERALAVNYGRLGDTLATLGDGPGSGASDGGGGGDLSKAGGGAAGGVSARPWEQPEQFGRGVAPNLKWVRLPCGHANLSLDDSQQGFALPRQLETRHFSVLIA